MFLSNLKAILVSGTVVKSWNYLGIFEMQGPENHDQLGESIGINK